MDEKWYWTELIGFDREQGDYAVGDFLSRTGGTVMGVSLLLYSIDFINLYEEFEAEKPLLRSVCSYGGHAFNEEREIQKWTQAELLGLIDTLHENGVRVLLCVFDLYYYMDEKGATCGSDFIDANPEICTFCSAKFISAGAVSIMKRFRSGAFYRDFFMEKLTAVLVDFGFDGYQLADGLSSPRYCIQSGDFSDDIVEQFTAATSVVLPEELCGAYDGNKRKHIKRYNYIMEHERFAFTRFIADWFADFYQRLAASLSAAEKALIVNNAWTRDPFEALFRYGIDYAALAVKGISAIMMEDVGSSLPRLSAAGLGGFFIHPYKRRYANYTMFLTQLAIKAQLPKLRQLNMTPLKDTQEDWNMIDAAPFEVHKMIVRRRNTWLASGDGYQRASGGAFYCLSDGLPQEKWKTISAWEHFAELADITGVLGFTAVWEPESLYHELQRFIDERKPSSKHLFEEITKAGIPVSSMIRAEDIKQYRSPLLAANAELYPDATIQALECYTAAPLVLVGYHNPLKRKSDVSITNGADGIGFYFFNCGNMGDRIVDIKGTKGQVHTGFRDSHGGIWTAPLRHEQIDGAILKAARETCDGLALYPVVTNGADSHITAYLTGKSSAILLVTNDSFAAADVTIRFPYTLASARSLNKPHWYALTCNGNSFKIHINNRAMEVLEVTWQDCGA